ncbi:MAG: NADH-quinone oxidoreductase subunit J, partial [Ktedonobacteraceae bacterium]
MNGLIEWVIFSALSAVVLIMAASMIITMSMYRAGLALMASFVALAGLFILLDADLIAAIQIMMNVGGMLVMVLFMVMMMMDPGGEMMWGMKRAMHLPGPGAFSMHMPRGKPPEEEPAAKKTAPSTDWTCPTHAEVSSPIPGTCPKCGMTLIPRAETDDGQDSTAQAIMYTCPMHPEVQEHAPGKCPKCGMTLLPVNDTAQSHAADGHQGMGMDSTHADTMAIPHAMLQMDGESDHALPMEMHGDGMDTMDMPGHDLSKSSSDM